MQCLHYLPYLHCFLFCSCCSFVVFCIFSLHRTPVTICFACQLLCTTCFVLPDYIFPLPAIPCSSTVMHCFLCVTPLHCIPDPFFFTYWINRHALFALYYPSTLFKPLSLFTFTTPFSLLSLIAFLICLPQRSIPSGGFFFCSLWLRLFAR